MKLRPINDNVIIELPVAKDELLSSKGIIMSTNNNALKPDRAVVVACGEGRIHFNGDVIPMKVKVGEEIIFNRFAGTELIINDKKHLIIKESDILAIFS